jgi:hypothetical protein
LVVFMGFELVFGSETVTKLFLEDCVFMGGVLLGCGWMMFVGWDGKFLSAGPMRNEARERKAVGRKIHGCGGGGGGIVR